MNELILQSLADEIGSKSLELALVKAQLTVRNQEHEETVKELNRVVDEYTKLKALVKMEYDSSLGEFVKKEDNVDDTTINS